MNPVIRGQRTVGSAAVTLLLLTGLPGCTDLGVPGAASFSYKDLPVAKESAEPGAGHSVTLQGKPLELEGPGLQTGETLRAAEVAKTDLSVIDIANTRGTVRIISVVPSLDTKVCEQQTHYLSEKNNGLDKSVELITVSVDTPFAQKRFAEEAKINNVSFLSDYRSAQFGRAHGLLLTGPHILARTVMVVDQENVIRYMQVTPELAQMPDMEAAFGAARDLVGS